MARMAIGSSADIPQILLALDQGTMLIKFFKKKRPPERRVFCLKTDTFEILQFPMGRGKNTLSEETSASAGKQEGREGGKEGGKERGKERIRIKVELERCTTRSLQ